jgi:hypothetical protein
MTFSSGLEPIPKYRDNIGYPRYGESWLSGITNMVKTPAIYRLSPIYWLGKKKTSAERAQEAGFNNNKLSLEDWNINNQPVALLTPLANAS